MGTIHSYEAEEELDELLDANPDFAGPLHEAVLGDQLHGWRYLALAEEPCFVCVYGNLARLRGIEVLFDEIPGESEAQHGLRKGRVIDRIQALRIGAEAVGKATTPLEQAIAHVRRFGDNETSRAERTWLCCRIESWMERNAK